MPEYLLSMFDDESWHEQAGEEDWQAELQLHEAFAAAVEAVGCQITGGAALQPQATATTVHRVGGEVTLSDGPFAETKECLGGFYLLQAPDLDTAVRLARQCPAGHIEVRPVVNLEQYE
ncbi:hypothetical protein EII12_04050 [Buchananella hordeovulneris]|uniref:YciI family protein n=1 Tax=Buchananella hordeovulneris TaxID=52770 RepID=UPI000F6000E2|nr:YciI family protein [Buchananella hordeovulneris]RRD52754.1 hypothetical protein EII12_04050 [Buchananella hordeovulneris]